MKRAGQIRGLLCLSSLVGVVISDTTLRRTERNFEEEARDAIGHSVFDLAREESLGFFDDIPDFSWNRKKKYAKEMPVHRGGYKDSGRFRANEWYSESWESNFSCPQERRVGGLGDGPKWVCNPHRIKEVSEDRGCIVYSIGSNGEFTFEMGVIDTLGRRTCEVHIFDPVNYGAVTPNEPDLHFHHWGIVSENSSVLPARNYKSIGDTAKALGHEGKVVDIFKIDCEGCEFETYEEWFKSGLDIRQILVETHDTVKYADAFFETITNHGYVRFHKEANMVNPAGGGSNQEYAFLKLHDSFFE